MTSTDALYTTWRTIRSLYKKNTTETNTILRRIEAALSEKGYTKIGDTFYLTREVEKLTPIHDEPRSK